MLFDGCNGYICKAGCQPAPTSHMLKSGVARQGLNLMALTPHCVTYCSIASHMLIGKGQDVV